MKYKIGDRVRIVSDRSYGMFGKMNEYLGTVMTIEEADTASYRMAEDEEKWFWDDDMIEGLVSEYPSEAIESPYSYEKAVEGIIAHCKDTLLQKHKEYATEDDFHNFNVAAALQHITPEQALIGMMDKHVVSVHDLVNEHAEGRQVTVEKWREKIGDNINYLLILWAMVEKGLAYGTDAGN